MGAEGPAHDLGRQGELVAMGRGDKQEGHVGGDAGGIELFQNAADHLARGQGEVGVLGEGGGVGRQGTAAGSSVRGTTTSAPPVMWQWASMVP